MKRTSNTTVLLSKALVYVNVFCILLTLHLLSATFGFVLSSLFHLIAAYLILAVTFLSIPLRHTFYALMKKNPQQRKLIGGLLLILGGFLLLTLSPSPLLWLCSLPVILSGLHLCLEALNRRRRELYLLTVASFAYALVFLLLQTIPYLWSMYQQSSLFVSHGIGMLTGTPLLLGPTTSGLGIVLVTIVFLISACCLTPLKTKKAICWSGLCIGGLMLLWLFYLLFLSRISYTSGEAVQLHPVFFLFCLIPVFAMLYKDRDNKPTIDMMIPQQNHLKRFFKNGAVWAAVFLLLSTILLTLFIHGGAPPDHSETVVFYANHMVGTWDVPQYGTYGKDAVGMFGLWPVYLTTLGYKTELVVTNKTKFLNSTQPHSQNITAYLNLTDYSTIIETENITNTVLDGAAVFVVSNLNVPFSREEQILIWEYVRTGGSLLVIGDHTNVGGIQDPLNDLLEPVGIRYRFDAALPLDETFKWLTCTHLLHHPITALLDNIDELQYGIGASLDISSLAFPIIIGDSALSDNGNYSNEDIAYLGDYEYNKGEHLGDIILVAGAYYGNGKVLVFGDTSTFQNPALPFSYSFIQRTFSWLNSQQTTETTTLQLGSSLILLLGAVLVYRFFTIKKIFFALFPVLVCISLLLSMAINPMLLHANDDALSGNLICIDASHGERFSLGSFTDESINGLIVNLHRNNLLPIILRQFSKEKILKSKLLIFNAPTQPFTPEEVVFLQSYMDDGGIVIIATGYDDKDASMPLLKSFDVDIEQTPLGPVPYVEENLTFYQNEPRFVDSWPVSFQENQAVSFYNFTWGNLTFHLVVFIKQGTGGLLVISDSRFLLDRNVESFYDYWPGNILFLKYLLDELLIKGESL